MVKTKVSEPSSKNDLKGGLNHKEPDLCQKFSTLQLSENKGVDYTNGESSHSQAISKSPGGKKTPSDKKLESSENSAERKLHTGGSKFTFSQVSEVPENKDYKKNFPCSENRESSVIARSQESSAKSKDTVAINIEFHDNHLKKGSMSTSNQGPGNRFNSSSSPSRTNGLERSMNKNTVVNIKEECQELQDLKSMSSQFFPYIYSICEGEGFDKTDFYQKIDLLHAKHRLYDVLLSLNEKDQDTPLHVAIKKGKIDLTKEILHILDEPYKLDSFYKGKYFEREKPLFKVVSTRNKERKSVITLVIEGNDLEHIAAVFEYLAYDEETKQLLIECCGKVNSLSKKLVDIDKKSAFTKCSLSVAESIFAFLAGTGSILTVCDVIYYHTTPDNTSRATIKYTSPCNTTDTSPCNAIIEYISLSSFTSQNSFRLLAAFTSLMITLKYVINKVLSCYEKKDSILEERLKSCMEKRDKLGSELESALQCKVCIEKELRSFRESCSTQINSASVQPVDQANNEVFLEQALQKR
ncbi:hypothetical protein [Wolbachia endosymbiont (group A) of Lasioglossum morio]|uniref:hypothetical protein n=1 Tax=Wolbachia endosymbiont (group A) of Lasioglossum morio TaxID=2954025 RepID=UPI0022263FB8|nr:hypothetical protein [Wolbachia endosymbiont (group A) of Lasioglossum morio]